MNPHRKRPARRGFALMLVMVMTTLILSSWALANRRTAALLQLRQAQVHQLDMTLGSVTEMHLAAPGPEALGYALALMETGTPPIETNNGSGDTQPYLCRKTCRNASGDTVDYVIRFTPDPDVAGRWTIEAILADQWPGDPALTDIPVMPDSF